MSSESGVTVSELMSSSGVPFGTSGVRGLASAMTDKLCHAYASAFLQYLRQIGEFSSGDRVALAGDLRTSTPRILAACATAVQDCGGEVVFCGLTPTPALALHAMGLGIPSIMVTGSHIPADRNGIKFYRPHGEVLKSDEAGIVGQRVQIDPARYGNDDSLLAPVVLPAVTPVDDEYIARYVRHFGTDALSGLTIGVYQHTAVGRDVLVRAVEALGATAVPFGRETVFVPVDTEAIREEDIALAASWAAENKVDAIISTDGDSDRPLVADASGTWLRGDIVGLLVTSFYHPFFLAFNLVLVLLVVIIWRIWANASIASAVAKSHAKHATAHWLGTVGGSNGVYKSSRHMAYAIQRSEDMTAGYVTAHRHHFRYTFGQTIALLLLYALASAGLLAMGGWLILQGELSIGQLVAAELILSGVFYGIAQLGTYLEVFYELSASLEELHLFWELPQEAAPRNDAVCPPDGSIRMRDVYHGAHHFDFAVPSGAQVGVLAAPGVERTLATLLKRLEVPRAGIVSVGGADLASLDMYRLRSDVIVLDRPTIVEMSVRDYLGLGDPERPEAQIDALELVGLDRRVGALPGGLDALLSSSGFPLTVGETMALKLAGAVLARPRVLMLSPIYDMLPPTRLDRVFAALRPYGTTILQFTGRPEGIKRDSWLWIGPDVQAEGLTVDDVMHFAVNGQEG